MKTALPLSLLILLSVQTAKASSDEAWAAFEKTVEEKCVAAASGMIENPEAAVDPIGSERFGLAIVTGKAVGANARVSHICVMDKQTQAVELGSELGEDRVTVELPD